MGKLSDIRNDVEKMVNGVWVPYEAGIKLKIARMYNEEHSKCMAQLNEERLDDLRDTAHRVKVEREIMRESVARTVLRDWENLEDDDGKTIPFSVDKAIELFNDPRYRDFYDFVVETALRRFLYKETTKRIKVKN